jgi:hypothetical protein
MIAQIQTHLSHFLTKLVALALFLFILTSFNLQIITATAQTGNTPAKPDTTNPTTNTGTTTGKNILTQNEVDSRIGSLKNCTVNEKNETELKTDPNAANTFIFKCLKDIIQIVITISVILAVMRLIFVGIKFLNTFDNQDTLNAELSKTITGFVAGAVILGLFATIIQVVNPSALKIDKIFSAQVIADYKCLNKGISDPNAKTVATSGCKDNKQGSGPGGSNEVFTSESIAATLASTKPEDATAKELIGKQISNCNKSENIYLSSPDEAQKCVIFQQYAASNPKSEFINADPVDQPFFSNMTGDKYANGTYNITKVDGKVITVEYQKAGQAKGKTIIFKLGDNCEKSPFLTEKTITSGKPINLGDCKVEIPTNK